MSPDVPALRTRDLAAGYRSRRRTTTVLTGMDLTARAGELVTLVGANGAGKSTLLRTLVGAQAPLAGAVELDGRDLHAMPARRRARRLAVVLTEPVNVGLLTVEAVIALGRTPFRSWNRRDAPAHAAAVDRAVADAGVGELRHRMIGDLSDGERQRVMVARALAQEPSVLILDEPTAFLDASRRIELAAMLSRLASATGTAIVLSTHDLAFALRRSDRMWLVADGTVTAAAPEDLAWSGRIADVFAGDRTVFDDRAADIVVAPTAQGRPIEVRADGRSRHWAEHAVRRAGWTPVPAHEHARLVVDGAAWTLTAEGGTATGADFASLVERLRHRTPVGRQPAATDRPDTRRTA